MFQNRDVNGANVESSTKLVGNFWGSESGGDGVEVVEEGDKNPRQQHQHQHEHEHEHEHECSVCPEPTGELSLEKLHTQFGVEKEKADARCRLRS